MNKRVLVVDDDAMLCELFSTGFQLAGFDVDIVHDGEDAVEFLRHNTVDVVTLDHDMPGLSGKEVLEKLKEEQLAVDTKIIIVTASNQLSSDKYYKEMGDHILIKPVGFRQLSLLAEKLIM